MTLDYWRVVHLGRENRHLSIRPLPKARRSRRRRSEALSCSSNVCSESGQQPDARPEQARVFFALWPQPEVARYLADVADSVATRAGGRATRQAAIHLTLAFIGDVAIERLPDLERAARAVHCEAFDLTLDRFGLWRHNRIFHAGCSVPPAALAALLAALTAALSAAGFAVADARRTFIPHVTLVRKLVALNAELPECEPVAWSNRQFVLARSTPSAHGSSYRTIAEFPLARVHSTCGASRD